MRVVDDELVELDELDELDGPVVDDDDGGSSFDLAAWTGISSSIGAGP